VLAALVVAVGRPEGGGCGDDQGGQHQGVQSSGPRTAGQGEPAHAVTARSAPARSSGPVTVTTVSPPIRRSPEPPAELSIRIATVRTSTGTCAPARRSSPGSGRRPQTRTAIDAAGAAFTRARVEPSTPVPAVSAAAATGPTVHSPSSTARAERAGTWAPPATTVTGRSNRKLC